MSKKEMFELLENMQNGLSKKDMEYTNIRITEMEKRFEKVDENKWNEVIEKQGVDIVIGSAIDYVFDGTELNAKIEREYKNQIAKSIKVKAKIESGKDIESHRAYWND